MSKEVQLTPLFLGFFIFSMMIHAVLSFMLLLPGMVMTVNIIIQTQRTITCDLPTSVSHALGIQSYTFIKLTELSTEEIFMEYTKGLVGQIPISNVFRKVADQLALTMTWEMRDRFEEIKDWTSALQIQSRCVVAMVVSRVGRMEMLRGRNDAHSIVFRILDGIRGTHDWVEFAAFLETLDDSAWRRVVEEVLAPPVWDVVE
jgi:hypothetical protein